MFNGRRYPPLARYYNSGFSEKYNHHLTGKPKESGKKCRIFRNPGKTIVIIHRKRAEKHLFLSILVV